MKILSIEITNTKKLRAFFKNLNGKNMEVAGSTATGKTTAISALWEIISKQGDALTHGEKKGCIRVKLGDGEKSIIAERKFTPSGSTIAITAHTGDEVESINVSDFKKMLSGLAVNPHKIMGMGPTERVRTLMAAANLDIDLEALDVKINKAETARLEAFRDMENIEPGEEPEMVEAVNTTALVAEKQRIADHNTAREKLLDSHDALLAKTAECRNCARKKRNEAIDLNERIKILERDAAELEKQCEIGEEASKEIATEIDKSEFLLTEEIDAKLATIDETNQKAGAHKAYKAEVFRYEVAKEAHLEALRYAKECQDEKKDALAKAERPLEGLSIDDGNVLYNGSLMENLGESEQMLVTSALAVRDIEKHPLKIVRMDGVESMSKADFDKLQALFNERGIQVLSTRVSRGDVEPQELVIVDGVFEDEAGE